MDLFAQRNPGNGHLVQRIKAQIADRLELDSDATIMVTELNCQDDDCPEVETVIAIFRPDRAKVQITLHSSIEELTDPEIEQLCRDVQDKSNHSEETTVALDKCN